MESKEAGIRPTTISSRFRANELVVQPAADAAAAAAAIIMLSSQSSVRLSRRAIQH